MPLVLTENESTESGIIYEDRTGLSYQYPKMYRRLVTSGERFVYYRGRRKHDGTRAPQIYFGVGLIGDIATDPGNAERLVCQVLDYQPFARPVAFKTGDHGYLETGGTRRGYFQQGVRRVSDSDYQRILQIGSDSTPLSAPPAAPTEGTTIRAAYASAQTSRAVEDFSVRVAVEEIIRRHPLATVEVQARNNPGFDLRVLVDSRVVYVEIKGTQRGTPVFFATEGELQFSRRNSENFWLIVVYRITLDAATHRIMWHEGAISSDTGFGLKPVQWSCERDVD